MPPYANQEQYGHLTVREEPFGIDSIPKNVPVRYKLVGEPDSPKPNSDAVSSLTWNLAEATKPKPKRSPKPRPPSILERLLEANQCNPCSGIIPQSMPSLVSATVFKIRRCSECGEPVHKFKGGGYTKEKCQHVVVDERTGEESMVASKLYFHSFCLRRKQDREKHRTSFASVLVELQEVVKLMAEERKKRKEEEEDRQKAEAAADAAADADNTTKAPKKRRTSSLAKTAKRYLKLFSRKKKIRDSGFRGVEV